MFLRVLLNRKNVSKKVIKFLLWEKLSGEADGQFNKDKGWWSGDVRDDHHNGIINYNLDALNHKRN